MSKYLKNMYYPYESWYKVKQPKVNNLQATNFDIVNHTLYGGASLIDLSEGDLHNINLQGSEMISISFSNPNNTSYLIILDNDRGSNSTKSVVIMNKSRWANEEGEKFPLPFLIPYGEQVLLQCFYDNGTYYFMKTQF